MNVEEQAQNHAEWYAKHFSKIVLSVYKDAFIHGYKHAREEYDRE